jgi:sterol desaturase/sphingolipid hydroxylase (fatty acid hydroxylase superfamily)
MSAFSTTSLRNTIWSTFLHLLFVRVPTLMVCGIHSLSIVGTYLFFRMYGFFNHANIRLDLGPLTPVISGPQWHRILHSREEEYFNKNFAAFFPIIDIVFGTCRRPKPRLIPAAIITWPTSQPIVQWRLSTEPHQSAAIRYLQSPLRSRSLDFGHGRFQARPVAC